MKVDASVVAAVTAAVAAIVGSWLTYRVSKKSNDINVTKTEIDRLRVEMEIKKADDDHYAKIVEDLQAHNRRLREQVDRMTVQMEAVQAQLAKEEEVSNALRDQIRTMRRQIATLEQLVDELQSATSAAARRTTQE